MIAAIAEMKYVTTWRPQRAFVDSGSAIALSFAIDVYHYVKYLESDLMLHSTLCHNKLKLKRYLNIEVL